MNLYHLNTYLPYNLLMSCPYDSFDNIQLLTGLNQNEFETTYLDLTNIDINNSAIGNYWAWRGENNYANFEVKPLLLPKTHLLDEITVNNKTNYRIHFIVEDNYEV